VQHLLIINGWSANAHFWDDFIAGLQGDYLCEVIDLEQGMTLDESMQLIDDHIFENSLILGWSLGGTLAAYYAANSGKVFRGLILLQSSPCFVAQKGWAAGLPLDEFQSIYRLVVDQDFKLLVRHFTHLLVNGSDQHKVDRRFLKLRYTEQGLDDNGSLQAGLNLLSNLDVRESLSRINVPCLHVFGQQDALVSVLQVDEIKALVPAHRFNIIDDMAHFPCGAYREAVQTCLNNFVNDL